MNINQDNIENTSVKALNENQKETNEINSTLTQAANLIDTNAREFQQYMWNQGVSTMSNMKSH